METQTESPDIGSRVKVATGSYRWRSTVVSLLAFCLGIAVTCGLVLWLAGPSYDSTETVARAWNRTISKLDIEPLFPPQEDTYVGDVFVIVANGEGPDDPDI